MSRKLRLGTLQLWPGTVTPQRCHATAHMPLANPRRTWPAAVQDYLVDASVLKQQLEAARSRLLRKALQEVTIDDGTIPVHLSQAEDGEVPVLPWCTHPMARILQCLAHTSRGKW